MTLTPEEASELRDRIYGAASDEPLRQLTASVIVRQEAAEMEAEAVERARLIGYSWQEIADALGVSRQTAHARHRRIDAKLAVMDSLIENAKAPANRSGLRGHV